MTRVVESLESLARLVLIPHQSIGGPNDAGGVNPPCACPNCRLANAVLKVAQ